MNEKTDRFELSFLLDRDVTPQQDTQLRRLLALCFPREAARFQRQRFVLEKPTYRWVISDSNDQIIAQLALHRKKIKTERGEFEIGGIAEVAVHPNYRRRGLAKRLLQQAESFLAQQGVPFAVLFGKREIYQSSGYRPVPNPIRYLNHETGLWVTAPHPDAMYKKVSDIDWPSGIIDLDGFIF